MQHPLPEFFLLGERFQLPTLDKNWRLHVIEEVDSTNKEALRRLSAGRGVGEIIVAKKQTMGQGKIGRSWISLNGNLTMTVTLGTLENQTVSDLSFVAAVSIVDSVNPLLPKNNRLQLKWPNDILLNDKKLGGILIENSEIKHAAVVGIGLNLLKKPQLQGLNAACLVDYGCTVSFMELAILIANNFSIWIKRWNQHGLRPIIAAWRTAALGIGKPIIIRFPNHNVIRGKFVDVAEDGKLLVKTTDGLTHSVFAGDMFMDGEHATSNRFR